MSLFEPDIFRACVDGELENVKKLLDEGVDVNIRDNDGWTPLMDAVLFGRLDIIDELVNRGADIDVVDNDGMSALMFPNTDKKNILAFKKLIFYGANYNAVDKKGRNMLDFLSDHREDRKEIEEYISTLPSNIKPAKRG